MGKPGIPRAAAQFAGRWHDKPAAQVIEAKLEQARAWHRLDPSITVEEGSVILEEALDDARRRDGKGREQSLTQNSTRTLATGKSAVVKCASDVEEQHLESLWWLCKGKLNVLVGMGGQGKGFITVDLAARITQGFPWPDRSANAPIGNVLFIAGEDAFADTVKPRLRVAGADMSRVFFWMAVNEGDKTRDFSLKYDLELLRQQIQATEAMLAVLDPLNHFAGESTSGKRPRPARS